MVDAPKSFKAGQRVFLITRESDLFTNGHKTSLATVAAAQCRQGATALVSDMYVEMHRNKSARCVPTDLIRDIVKPGTKVLYYPLYGASFYAPATIVNGRCSKKQTAIQMTGKQYPRKPYECVASDRLDPASLGPVDGGELVSPANITKDRVVNAEGDEFIDGNGTLMIKPGPGRTIEDAMKIKSK